MKFTYGQIADVHFIWKLNQIYVEIKSILNFDCLNFFWTFHKRKFYPDLSQTFHFTNEIKIMNSKMINILFLSIYSICALAAITLDSTRLTHLLTHHSSWSPLTAPVHGDATQLGIRTRPGHSMSHEGKMLAVYLHQRKIRIHEEANRGKVCLIYFAYMKYSSSFSASLLPRILTRPKWKTKFI